MAYPLKTTGQALDLRACLTVDEDGTIKDLVPGNTVTWDPMRVAVGERSRKGQTRKYLSVTGDGWTPYGVKWTGSMPVVDMTSGACVVIVAAGSGAGAENQRPFLETAQSGWGVGLVLRSDKRVRARAGDWDLLSTSLIPTDGDTGFTLAWNYTTAARTQLFYALETATTVVAEAAVVAPGDSSTQSILPLISVGGSSGNGHLNYKAFAVLVFEGERTEEQLDAIHADWFDELVGAGAVAVKVLRVTEIIPGAIGQAVRGTVFAAPALGNATGPEVGKFTGKTIVAHDVGVGFDIDATELGIESMPVGAQLRVLWESDTWGSAGTHLATIVEP